MAGMSAQDKGFYSSLGVSARKGDVHAAVGSDAGGLFPGAFCKIIPDSLTGSKDHCLALHADGAGTKSVLAYLWWKETGDVSVFRGISQDSLVMNIDDLACVGATGPFLLSNTIARNAHRIPKEVLREVIEGYKEVAWMLGDQGVTVELCGGETADLGDLTGTLIVDSTACVRLERSKVVDASRIRVGDAIVGLYSFGQTKDEKRENSGIGSNGLTAARHALLRREYALKYPEAFSSSLKPEEVFAGRFGLSDTLPGSDLTVGQALLSPTRSYAPFVKRLLGVLGVSRVHGLIHNSGGGLGKCLRFGNGLSYVKDALPAPPPLFRALAESGHLGEREMNEVFNMGVRLEVYVDPRDAAGVLSEAKALGIGASVIGRVEASDGANQLRVIRDGRTETYSL